MANYQSNYTGAQLDAGIAKANQAASDLVNVKKVITTENYSVSTLENIFPSITWTSGYMTKGGGINAASSMRYSNKIPVLEGDVISFANSNYDFRYVTAFADDTANASLGAENVNRYTVPAGINYVVVTEYTSRGDAAINRARTEAGSATYIKRLPMGYMATKGTLANGGKIQLPYHNVKNHNIYIFNANITEFGSIKFGKEHSLVVDGTNISITNDATSPTIPHGLTIGKNITLVVENETSTNVSKITLSSDGQEFVYNTPTRLLLDSGYAFIQSINSTLTDCTLSWVSKNINAPIWIFGDSYLSWYEERWTYYLARDEFVKSVMLNGYAGQASASAYESLSNLLAITTPKIVVWCLGMNDGDTSSAVNASWNEYYQKVVELQKKYGFELVLYTVPTTPTINNNFKNAIIKESGFRYIDADSAVRIDSEGHWVTGALDSDNVHPTALGAKILYYRIISEVPEILSNN